MKTVRYFNRSYAVPGEALSEALDDVAAATSVIARVHYRVYQRPRTVVFTGIDRFIPNYNQVLEIINLIAVQEQINPHDYSWLDLQTAMQDERIPVGQYKFLVIFLQPGSNPIEGQCIAEAKCTKLIERHFVRYIYSQHYCQDRGFSPEEFEQWLKSQEAEGDDGSDDDGREPIKGAPGTPDN